MAASAGPAADAPVRQWASGSPEAPSNRLTARPARSASQSAGRLCALGPPLRGRRGEGPDEAAWPLVPLAAGTSRSSPAPPFSPLFSPASPFCAVSGQGPSSACATATSRCSKGCATPLSRRSPMLNAYLLSRVALLGEPPSSRTV